MLEYVRQFIPSAASCGKLNQRCWLQSIILGVMGAGRGGVTSRARGAPAPARSRKVRSCRVFKIQLGFIAASFALTAVVVVRLAPASHERPIVTVYMQPGCETCRRWMRHLDSSGFRARIGTEVEMSSQPWARDCLLDSRRLTAPPWLACSSRDTYQRATFIVY